eukprot:1141570-Pleurochrysis_carterae.AAC.2
MQLVVAALALGARTLTGQTWLGSTARSQSSALATLSMSEERCQIAPESYTLISTNLLAELLRLFSMTRRNNYTITACSHWRVGLSCTPHENETPALAAPLRNRYFGLRHGQSEANVAGIISSDPSIGTTMHGLTALGRLQARRAATTLVDLVGRENLGSTHFYSSDFTRALQTAEEALAGVINLLEYENSVETDDSLELPALPSSLTDGVKVTPLVRERYFGDFDGTVLSNYQQARPPTTMRLQ